MKKFSALAGALLLSSSLLAGCTPNAAPDNNANNRTGTYNTDRAGRIMDNSGVGVRNSRVDQDRLGVRDNLGPDRRPNVLTNDVRDRMGVRDQAGRDTAYRNLRVDRSLEARVEAIPGIRDAKVLTNGNVAYVGINQGTNLGGGNRAGIRSDVPPTAGHQANRNAITNRANNVSQYGGTMSDRDFGTTGLTPQTPLTPQTGTYGTTGTGTYGTGTGSSLFGTGIGTGMGTYGTGRGYGPSTYGTGTYGTGNTYGVGTYGTGTYGTGMGTYSNGNYGNGGVTGTDGTRGAGRTGAGLFGTSGNNRVGTYTNNTGTNIGTNNNAGMNRTGTYANNTDVSNDIKDRVISAVKQGNPSITTVYVSANPALYNRMDAFVRDAASGHPLRGLGDLGDMFRRLFPTTGTAGFGAGTNTNTGTTTGTTTGRTMGNTGGTTSGVTNR
ncbi:sporulation lipoprotein YhcN/YlaJ [Tumebacillus sp. BK434]|uniref:YhcN/YlaJ family sporulation lipoprotein n=1 Tax=Tumebacillus sp. BK434 TaxID=2512169 RepID=UPI00105311A9|nr:YhcN/YlaJ family sporulation lipoprotein [Tumebacillus sp. BK434]TCP54389.1 sporulation lipoprotein YhcN/YlaJ [Tumebacillus sp. BK434]